MELKNNKRKIMPLFEINLVGDFILDFYFCGPQELKDTIIHVQCSLLYNWYLVFLWGSYIFKVCYIFMELHEIMYELLNIS